MSKFIALLIALSTVGVNSLTYNVPNCEDGFALGEGNGNSIYLGVADSFDHCVSMAQEFVSSDPANAGYTAVSFALRGLCDVLTGMTLTNGDPYIKTCIMDPETHEANAGTSRVIASAQGDPTFVGQKGQVFKFDGEDGKWYSNLETKNFNWNMQFRKYNGCPEDESMFISGLTFLETSDPNFTLNILIQTTPAPIPECMTENANCLGGGTLHISFDGGNTFISDPGDYRPTPRGRLVAHNTYSACSREWFDYAITKKKEKEAAEEAARHLRSRNLKSATNVSTDDEKKPFELMYEKTSTMIDPTECKDWISERREHHDLFTQKGLWSTLYIETDLVSLHIEYRQSNPENAERKCDFQSLDAWISEVSEELDSQQWNGILGETKEIRRHPETNEEIMRDRSQILRGQSDSDYEVEGPFGLKHAASLSNKGQVAVHTA